MRRLGVKATITASAVAAALAMSVGPASAAEGVAAKEFAAAAACGISQDSFRWYIKNCTTGSREARTRYSPTGETEYYCLSYNEEWSFPRGTYSRPVWTGDIC